MIVAPSFPDPGRVLGEGAALAQAHFVDELRRMRVDPMTYGVPANEPQERLHCSRSKHVLFVAANRIGKSTGGTRECLWRARGAHPYKPVRRHRLIVVGILDFTFYKLVSLPMLERWLPRHWLAEKGPADEKWFKIRHVDGGTCTLQYKTFEQGRQSWQGFGAEYIWLDEEHPEDVYGEAFARVIETRGDLLQTFTPLGGLGWTYDRLYLPATTGQRPDIEVIEAAMAEYDETRPYGVGRVLVKHLKRQDVIRFAREYPDEDERAIRVFGQYRSRVGTVFKAVRAEVHRVPAFKMPRHFQLWGGLDPGFRGFAASFYGMSPEGRIYACGEYYSQHEDTETRLKGMWAEVCRFLGLSTEEAAAAEAETAWEDDEGTPTPPPAPMTPTPDAPADFQSIVVFVDTEDPQTVLELNLAAARAHVPLVFSSLDQGLKARKSGILRVQQLLEPLPGRAVPAEVERPGTRWGEPILYVLDDLHSSWLTASEERIDGSRLWWELGKMRWKKAPQGRSIAPDDADDMTADGAHMLSSLRYAMMARMGAPAPVKESHREHLPPWVQEVWDDAEKMEQEQLEAQGAL